MKHSTQAQPELATDLCIAMRIHRLFLSTRCIDLVNGFSTCCIVLHNCRSSCNVDPKTMQLWSLQLYDGFATRVLSWRSFGLRSCWHTAFLKQAGKRFQGQLLHLVILQAQLHLNELCTDFDSGAASRKYRFNNIQRPGKSLERPSLRKPPEEI
jgi:hypothetical protein